MELLSCALNRRVHRLLYRGISVLLPIQIARYVQPAVRLYRPWRPALFRADKFNHRTYSLVNTLMVYSINTGLVTRYESLEQPYLL